MLAANIDMLVDNASAPSLSDVSVDGSFGEWSPGLEVGQVNLVIAVENSFTVILIARSAAGVAAGLIWSNIGGIAARLVPEKAQGRAIAVALAGTPAALSLGLPAGTVLGDATSWHATFGVMAALSAALIVWVLAAVPNLPAEPNCDHASFASVLRAPAGTRREARADFFRDIAGVAAFLRSADGRKAATRSAPRPSRPRRSGRRPPPRPERTRGTGVPRTKRGA